MKKTILLFGLMSLFSCGQASDNIGDLEKPAEQPTPSEPEEELPALTSFPLRVNIQSEYATPEKIIDNEWVAVGISRPYALQIDEKNRYNGKHTFRFELRNDDNSLEGYNENETKGRAEVSYCYATEADFASLPANAYSNAQRMKTVYHHGK